MHQVDPKILIIESRDATVSQIKKLLKISQILFLQIKDELEILRKLKKADGEYIGIILTDNQEEGVFFHLMKKIKEKKIKYMPPMLLISNVQKKELRQWPFFYPGISISIETPFREKDFLDKIFLLKKIFYQKRQNDYLEKMLERSSSLVKSLNQELIASSHLISHDIKAPLRHIDGFVESFFLEEEREEKTEEKNGDLKNLYKSKIKEALKRINRIIDKVVDFIKYGGSEVKRSEIWFSEIFDVAKSLHFESLEKAKAKCVLKNDAEIYVDREKFIELTQILIENGLQFADPGRRPCINLSIEEKADHWHLKVEDNGIGIKEKYHQIVFDFTRRLHSKDEIYGTGIGLSLCRKIVWEHKGSIDIESIYQEGTIFHIKIPMVSPKEKRPDPS